ncbi:MAG: M17 family peptidase N-terminal domain-containing protein [Burkholderiales bacterium]
MDRAAGGALARALASGDFKGKKDETLLLYRAGPARRVLLVGVGPRGQPREGSTPSSGTVVASGRRRHA